MRSPEIYRYSLDLLLKEIADAANLGINAIALFPLIATEKKDNAGKESYNPDGLVQRTVKAIKQEIPDLTVIQVFLRSSEITFVSSKYLVTVKFL